jgi:hypothetical protein
MEASLLCAVKAAKPARRGFHSLPRSLVRTDTRARVSIGELAIRREVGAVPFGFPWLNAGVLDKARAEELADGLDLDRLTYCAACVFELAWAIHTGHAPHWQTVARVADWTWAELGESLFAALVDARMREVRFAEEGLRDLRERGHQTAVARAVVLRLAERMADEITHTSRE